MTLNWGWIYCLNIVMCTTYSILHQNNYQGSKVGYDSGPFLKEKLTRLHGRAVYAIILQCSCKAWYSKMHLCNFIWINVHQEIWVLPWEKSWELQARFLVLILEQVLYHSSSSCGLETQLFIKTNKPCQQVVDLIENFVKDRATHMRDMLPRAPPLLSLACYNAGF